MANLAPDRKVGIVQFNDEVSIIGDGINAPSIVAGDKLLNYEFLLENGINEGNQRMQKNIKETKPLIQEKLMSIEETGPTALGPALVTAIGMAS